MMIRFLNAWVFWSMNLIGVIGAIVLINSKTGIEAVLGIVIILGAIKGLEKC